MCVTTTKDNLALVVLCSTLGYTPEKSSVKPLTVAAYNKLEARLNEMGFTPSLFLNERMSDISEWLLLDEKEAAHLEALLLRADKLGEELERLAEKNIYVTSRTQDNYPAKLKNAMGAKAPVIFFFCGEIRLLEAETVAIIGSREVTEGEHEYAAKHARISAQNGKIVISGGAKGVDTIAKEAALSAGGKVITYVSDNMTGYIEKNSDYIRWDRMLVLSAFHPDAGFQGYNALERNKFIYASSDYAVVVSSGDGTGGSFKGAVECLKKKYCPVYVKDDEHASPGNKKLIELGGLPLNEAHERLL